VIVVIDTNVWISAFQFAKRRGTPTLALEKASSGERSLANGRGEGAVLSTCECADHLIGTHGRKE
jgi:hypothetical protein